MSSWLSRFHLELGSHLMKRAFGVTGRPCSSKHHQTYKSDLRFSSNMQTPRLLNDFEKSLKPRSYTSGGWLHQDQLQREARYIDFDFGKLCTKARNVCPGSPAIIDIQKTEGGFNRCFIFEMSNGTKVVSRIPTKLAGPTSLTTRSEVATMQLVSATTSIPVPKILEWCDDPSNEVGCEYMIMEYVDAVRLGEIWDDMNAVQRIKCTERLSRIFTELSNLDFEGYGCLTYETQDQGIQTLNHDSVYSIGPHCGSRYWKCDINEVKLYGSELADQGPWRDLSAYVSGLYDTAVVRVPSQTPSNTPDWKGTREEVLRLLEQSYAVMQAIIKNPKVQTASTPVLSHPDFDMKNIFVSRDDPTNVVSIIDWQSASIEPAFMFASSNPDFARTPEYAVLKVDQEHEAGVEKERKVSSLCAQAYDAILRLSGKRIRLARELPDSITRLFKLCPIAWIVGATAIRTELIRLNQEWSNLGFEGQCPYVPTEKELQSHNELYEECENALTLKKMVMQLLGCNEDGHVLNDRLDTARKDLPTVIDWWIQTCTEPEDGITEEEARNMFPFDGR